MNQAAIKRRKFINSSAKAAAGIIGLQALTLPLTSTFGSPRPTRLNAVVRIKFAVIGLNHGHINSLVETAISGGGQLVSFYAKEPELSAAFAKQYPDAKMASDKKEILEDKSIQLIVSAAIPNERAAIGIEAMQHGKDFMVDKPGITSLEQLEQVREVQKKTKCIYSIFFGDRFENKATIKANELVKNGAIGKVIQTIGLGPHAINLQTRPSWFFEREKYGGILTDIGSHQFDQFLMFTNSTEAEIVTSQVGNFNHKQYPELEDFGDAMLRANGVTGYLRVDWFSPAGLKTWGDSRTTILGTEGYIELRKNIDIAGRPGANHLFLVDQKDTRYVDCGDVVLNYGSRLVDDILNRTETGMNQRDCFLATELSLRAQKMARKII